LVLTFEIAPSRKEVLLKGLDDIGTSLQHVGAMMLRKNSRCHGDMYAPVT